MTAARFLPSAPRGLVQTRAAHATRLVAAYAPIVYPSYPVGNTVQQPWLEGGCPADFGFTRKHLDIDLARTRAAKR